MSPTIDTAADVKLGVTLFSFTNEWLDGSYTLPTLLDRIAAENLGPGLEVIGFQSFRDFPRLTEQQVTDFRSLIDRTGLTPTALASNADVARRADRFMDTDESVDYMAGQIDAARRLGFPTVRIQIGLTPEVLEKLEPIAARAGVVLGMEIHAPEGPGTPTMNRVLEVYERIGSPYLGFIPDFSATMTGIPHGQVDVLRRAGLSPAGEDLLHRVWLGDGTPQERFSEFAELAGASGESPQVVGQARLMFSMFGHRDPQAWRELMPWIVHVHAKFYDVTPDGTAEPTIPYPELMQVLASGYRGWVSSEWEGHAWASSTDVDAFELVGRHQRMCRSLLESAALTR